MPRTMCGISPRRRSGTSLHGHCPHTARKRDRAQPRSCRTWPLPAQAMRLALGGGAGLPTTRALAQHVRVIGPGGARVKRLATSCYASYGKERCVGHT